MGSISHFASRKSRLFRGLNHEPSQPSTPRHNVFLICWIVYTIFWTPWILREHFPALTLIERGTLNVERYLGWTDDIFPTASHRAFINNNPGASLTGAIPLFLLRPALRSLEQWNRNVTPAPVRADDGEILSRALRERREFYLLAVAFLTVALAMAPATAGVMAYLAIRLRQHGATEPGQRPLPCCAASALPSYSAQEA